MVDSCRTSGRIVRAFQYSLCRVVLMVNRFNSFCGRGNGVSVLALSSRFDGPHEDSLWSDDSRFSTRSVESF